MELLKVLESAVDQGCSDVHLVVGRPPMMRQNGEIKPVSPSFSSLDAEGTKRLIYGMLVEEQRDRFETNWELDSSFAIPGLARFRVNVLRTQNGVEAVMRVISAKIPEAEAIGLTRPCSSSLPSRAAWSWSWGPLGPASRPRSPV
jgi:twitching motility protein PilT